MSENREVKNGLEKVVRYYEDFDGYTGQPLTGNIVNKKYRETSTRRGTEWYSGDSLVGNDKC